MGSQTLEILRQGVWASLTGGWFYDPHQGVFCNVVHLYLWLYLLCSPFVAYLYFPGTWVTWCIYCILTTLTILVVKMVNMALHRLYDHAQSMSEANLKNPFFKVTKETSNSENESGIELKVLGNDGSRNSVEQTINEASEENSMMSMENVNSIIDLKVDVHRKNSSESIELMFYAPSMISGNSQRDDLQSLAGSTSVTKSIRSTSNAGVPGVISTQAATEAYTKYLTVYPEHAADIQQNNSSIATTSTITATDTPRIKRQPRLLRKSSEDFRKRAHRRRLERQNSLDASAESAIASKLIRQYTVDGNCTCNSVITQTAATRNETFLHSKSNANATTTTSSNVISSSTSATVTTTAAACNAMHEQQQRLNTTIATAAISTESNVAINATSSTNVYSSVGSNKNTRLQRHRSSETHDERLKQQNRSIFLPIHAEHHHHHHHHAHHHHIASGASSSGALAAIGGGILDADEMELGLGGSSSGVSGDTRNTRALQSWILGSSSDVYLEDDSYTKSDFGIEQLDSRLAANAGRTAFLLKQQQHHLNAHYQHQQQHRAQQPHYIHHHHHGGGVSIRKDSNSTMSALQLPVAATQSSNNKSIMAGASYLSGNSNAGNSSGVGGGIKRRRHSNATSFFKSGSSAAALSAVTQQQPTVRRIKSAALEVACPQPSVSNLSPHPNSVEAINGQQQIKNPQSALLPPPSKCLKRNAHLNLCPKLGESFGGSSSTGSSINFDGNSACGSTTALIEPNNLPTTTIKETQHNKLKEDPLSSLVLEDISIDNEDLLLDAAASIKCALIADSHCDMDDDDELDDVPVRRRLKALDCRSHQRMHRHSGESDVGEILAPDEDDVFKDFDDNLEHILNDLNQTQNQLHDYLQEINISTSNNDGCVQQVEGVLQTVVQDNDTTNSDERDQGAATLSETTDREQFKGGQKHKLELENERQRLHSTDSETENNTGSRSPLLSAKSYENSASAVVAAAADKALRNEIFEAQKQRSSPTRTNSKNNNRILAVEQRVAATKGPEVDSGCPSSDCEQVSASSKDMLLAGMDLPDILPVKLPKADNDDPENQPSTSKAAAAAAGVTTIKNLGAIPKTVKYREIDETKRNRNDAINASTSSSTQLHKRRGGGGSMRNTEQTQSNINALAPSRATSSSSNSLTSINADSFSTDLHKILWLMHGVTVDERIRTVATLATNDINATKKAVMPSKISAARFQFYQDALHALQAAENNGLNDHHSSTLCERNYLRDKLKEAKQAYSEINNIGVGFGCGGHVGDDADDSQLNLASNNVQLVTANNVGVARAASSGMNTTLPSRDVTSIALAEILNRMNDERKIANTTQTTRNSSVTHPSNAVSGHSNAAAAGAVLNFENMRCETYCEYWRPPIILAVDKTTAPKSFYKYRFKFFGYEHEFKISMDRLELLALFDHDLHWIHILLSVFLCSLVAYLGASILQHGYYKDLFAFLFCAVIAGAQYSLVKSVQPDAASPIHGFNKTVAYSRAIYFSICSGLLLWLRETVNAYKLEPMEFLEFFGVRYAPAELATVVLHIMYILLLCFPLIFSLGLFPQVNTFLMYLLEQIDMHVFGGNAAGSLLGSFLCVCRSLVGVMLLYGPLYAALAEEKGTQYIFFSIFCAMLIPLGYHLSRSASDFCHLWALIKHCIVSTYRDDDDELSADSSNGTNHSNNPTTSTPKGAKNNKNSLKGQNSMSNENIEMSAIEQSIKEDEQNQFERKSGKSKTSSLGSSSQTLAKTLTSSKKAITASSSYASVAGAESAHELNAADERTTISESVETASFNVDDMPQHVADDDNKNRNHYNELPSNNDNNVVVVVDEQCDNNNTPANTKAQKNKTTTSTDNHDLADPAYVDEKISNSSTTHAIDMSTLTGAAGVLVDEAMDTSFTYAQNHNPNNDMSTDSEAPDPLPRKLQNTVNTRLKNDFVVSIFLAVVVLGLHCSTVFSVLQPELNIVLYAFAAALGLLLHYIIPQLRKHMPWLCFAHPILRQFEYGQFEVSNAPKIMWFEKAYIYFCILERNILFPLMVISALTADATAIAMKFGAPWGTVIVAVCALKFIRNAYSDPTNQYLIVMFTVLLFRVDFKMASETFLIDYFFVSIAFRKCCDFLLKLQFIVTYIAPWQITWGSAFHAFAQPFSVPHSAMLFLQAGVSAILSTPLNPFLGSAIFLTSYVRPIKFWERDYNTRRIDHSNTRLSSQLERDLGADDNNLNSIFYEHLTRSLQHSLCGDLLMGRWGNVNQGDCFVLASDYLNCLVHIVELGNGLCTFQMRGLEFRGTYCQQREVEAITEDVEDNDGCCCCDPGHLPRMLSANAMFSTRWLAWQVVAAQYVLEGYSISDNLASATLQVFEYRKVLITYYIKSIIYYVIKNPKLEQWLASGSIRDALQHTLSRQFVDLDPIFNYNLDEDFDFRAVGITRSSFCYVYLSWINFCYDKRKEPQTQKATSTTTAATSAHIPQPQATPTPSHISQQPTLNINTTTTPPTTTANVQQNDTRSSPNLASQTAQNKSQSQQQLRTITRPQKSATMSGSGNVSNNHMSSEQIGSTQSFASISRQTSESAPGLTAYATQQTSSPYSVEGNNYTLGIARTASIRTPPTTTATIPSTGAPLKPLRKDDSPRATTTATLANSNTTPNVTTTTTTTASDSATRDKLFIKLKVPTIAKDSHIVSLCLALGLLARRSLATASHSSLTGVEYFLNGLHALFKGDFRIQSPRDEWVFADMELLHGVVAPAVKMALKLQQDHISNPDEFLDPNALYEAIDTCSKDLVISHEADPVWRSAVLRGAPNLLALRHVMEDGSDEYRIIRLTKRFLSFRVIKLNRECVRGLWAGQQQELIYLRNRNPERGSIQNAKQALRNIINSSCDQPIGYPIYVSPLTTSYADTNEQLRRVAGGPITPESIKANFMDWWQRVRERCRQGCSSGSAMENSQMGFVGSMPAGMGGVGLTGLSGGAPLGGGTTCSAVGETNEVSSVYISAPIYNTLTVGNFFGLRSGNVPANLTATGNLSATYGSDNLAVMRGGLAMIPVKPTSTTLIAGLLNREREQEAFVAAVSAARELRVSSAGVRKSQPQTANGVSVTTVTTRNERERRATLPIASTSLGVVNINEIQHAVTNQNADSSPQFSKCDKFNEIALNYATSSPCYAKISCSSSNLGINNIITTPGDYPRKTKGPICLTAAAAGAKSMGERGLKMTTTVGSLAAVAGTEMSRKPRIELFKKVIIVDDTEIYDYLDMGLLTDFIWPNEEMRANGGLFSWNGWEPNAGMVGYVVHCWIPNHVDLRMRSPFNRIVYLIEIGEHYVPVGEYGLREYNQILDSAEEITQNSRRSSIQNEYDEFRMQQQLQQQRSEGLTPILGSSLESPTSQLSAAATSAAGVSTDGTAHAFENTNEDHTAISNNVLAGTSATTTTTTATTTTTTSTTTTITTATNKPKIQAVSSSSSEDEIGLYNYIDMQRREFLLNMWKLIAEKKKESSEGDATIEQKVEQLDEEISVEVDVAEPVAVTVDMVEAEKLQNEHNNEFKNIEEIDDEATNLNDNGDCVDGGGGGGGEQLKLNDETNIENNVNENVVGMTTTTTTTPTIITTEVITLADTADKTIVIINDDDKNIDEIDIDDEHDNNSAVVDVNVNINVDVNDAEPKLDEKVNEKLTDVDNLTTESFDESSEV